MKALTVHPYYAAAIVTGNKSVEVRTWKTDYRGDLVICSSAKKFKDTVPGMALGVVTLEDVVPLQKSHMAAALMKPSDWQPGMYAWILTYNRLIVPQPVKGKLSLWNYDGLIEYIPEEEWILPEGVKPEDGDDSWIEKYWGPYMI